MPKEHTNGTKLTPLPTVPPGLSIGRLRLARLGRQIVMGLLAAFILLGAVGFWGSRSSVVTASGNGFDLSVRYPSATRPGLPIRWQIEVHRSGGFDEGVVLTISLDYLNLLDVNGIEPEPSATHNRGDFLVWEFDPPAGDTFRVLVDAIAEPAVHWGQTATTSVLDHGIPAVTVRYRTRFMP